MARLYHVPLSPFCRKVRLTLGEKRVEVELVEERYWDPSQDFMRRNPAGKVPILRYKGTHLSESQAICEYLDDVIPSPPLVPKSADARYEMRRLCTWFDDKFHREVTANLVYERVNKKISGQGYPGFGAYQGGVCTDQVSSGLHGLAAWPATLACGQRHDAGGFHRRRPFVQP